jgi:hypothetical protein
MTQKVYRSAQGKLVDLGALQLQNEHVRAVGNMNVNARGDRLDSNNQSIQSRTNQVSKQYQRQTTNVSRSPIHSSNAAPKPKKVEPAVVDFLEDFDDSLDPTQAAAVIRSREISQDTPTQQ